MNQFENVKQQSEIPHVIANNLQQNFQTLKDICSQVHNNDRLIFQVNKQDCLDTILESINQIDLNEVNQNSSNEVLDILKNNSSYLTTEWYTQELLETAKNHNPKKEAIRVAMTHFTFALPNIQHQKEQLENSALESMLVKNFCDPKNYRLYSQNILLPYQQRFEQSNKIFKETLIHFSIYHPFTKKKTQEIVMLGSQTFENLKSQIFCIVQETQEEYYQDELQDQNEYSFSFCTNTREKIGNQRFQLQKHYLYTHLQQCQHQIIVNDIRPVGHWDCKEREVYYKGLNIFKSPCKIKSCEGCGKISETFRVERNRPTNDCLIFLCNECYKQLYNDNQNIPYVGH